MPQWNLDEALSIAEKELDRDRIKVVKQVALRAAQIKYVITRLRDHPLIRENPSVVEALEKMIPPMNDDALLAYALNAPEAFAHHVQPLLENEWARKPSDTLSKWGNEMEDALSGARRMVLQNFSKHPAMKPFRLLRELKEFYSRYKKMEWESAERAHQAESARGEQMQIEEEWETLIQRPGYETVTRLLDSQYELIEKRKRLSQEWLNVWKTVEPVLQSLLKKSSRFNQMENAQLRTLQLYLANPLSARTKDAHGAGLLMLIRLSVETLENQEENLSDAERTESRDVLLECLQNPFFSDYFEYVEEIDFALEQNRHALEFLPLNIKRIELEGKRAASVRNVERFTQEWEGGEQEKESMRRELKRLERDANEACQLSLGFQLIPLDA